MYKSISIETKESSFNNKNSFVQFMKYPHPNHSNSILEINIGSIYFCDLERYLDLDFSFWIRHMERAQEGSSGANGYNHVSSVFQYDFHS